MGSEEISKGQKIQQVFTDLNQKFEEVSTKRRARELSLPYFNLLGFPIEEQTLRTVPFEQAQSAEAVPFFLEGRSIKIGITDPQHPLAQKLISQLQASKYEVETYLVSSHGFIQGLNQYKKILSSPHTDRNEIILNDATEQIVRLRDLPELGSRQLQTPAAELLNLILGAAIAMRASDIHFEPDSKRLRIRFRVDGVLQEIVALVLGVYHGLLSRIKLASNMKLNVVQTPQDGSFTAHYQGKNLQFRVSTLPSSIGETTVLRILGLQGAELQIAELGLRDRELKLLREELSKTNGMILTTGPTGSGKTTTLYAFLNHLNKPGVKIITLEDPVEFVPQNITQVTIDQKAGMDFAKGLRAILRQDPDIIMVGEIRDAETATTAAQAALTGHIVLSTIHTNDSAGAVPRLLDLGVKPVSLAPSLNALIAQRLVRKICKHCKEIYHPTSDELEKVKRALAQLSPRSGISQPTTMKFYHGKGCVKCHDLGYLGRVGVFEVFSVDDPIERLIYKQAPSVEIKTAAIAQGMVTMQQDAILKALDGITDLAEVWRVTED